MYGILVLHPKHMTIAVCICFYFHIDIVNTKQCQRLLGDCELNLEGSYILIIQSHVLFALNCRYADSLYIF